MCLEILGGDCWNIWAWPDYLIIQLKELKLTIINARELKVVNPIFVVEENSNQLKRWTVCTPYVKLEKEIGEPHVCALACLPELGRRRGVACGTARRDRAVRCDVICAMRWSF